MENLKIKKLSDTAIIPMYQTEGSNGLDIHANILMPVMIKPGETFKIPTGLAMAIPVGNVGLIMARSGLATKNGLRPANCVGDIDEDYRGEVIVALHNDSDEDQVVYPQERIAQLVIVPYTRCNVEEVNELGETSRGGNGFGSTGI